MVEEVTGDARGVYVGLALNPRATEEEVRSSMDAVRAAMKACGCIAVGLSLCNGCLRAADELLRMGRLRREIVDRSGGEVKG